MSFQDEGYFDDRPNGLTGSPVPAPQPDDTGNKKDQHRRSVETLGLYGHDDEGTIAEIRRLINHYEPQFRHNVLVRIKYLLKDIR